MRPATSRDYRATLRADAEMARRFNRRFREAGILKGESKFYVSLAHDAADVRHTLDAVKSAVEAELAETPGAGAVTLIKVP